MTEANSIELSEDVFPTSGARRYTRCWDSWYDGDPTKEAIGLRGMFGCAPLVVHRTMEFCQRSFKGGSREGQG